MTLKEAIIQRILNLCSERALSINKLSTVCGMTQSTLNNIVNGRNKSVTTSTVKKICDGLGITIIDFFNDPLFRELEQEIK
ncbi:helix-turn-helix transcriptional regulator [Oscillospiraceae bacterium 44-34]|jgi:DNA-binding Xre family transcriptional regulator